MKIINDFNEYADVVIANISPSVLPDRLLHYADFKINETLRTLYRLEVDYKKASVILETFFKQFKTMLHVPIDEQDDYDYLNDDKYDI